VNPTLFIRVGEDPAAPVEWLRMAPRSEPSPVNRGPIAEAARGATASVVVLVPAACVTLSTTDLPTRNKSQLLKAVPYALEEELAEPVEELHFAVQGGRNQRTLVAVVRRTWLEALLQELRRHDLTPRALVPETLCLPWREEEWTLLLEDETAVLRTARQGGFAIDTDNFATVLDAALADAGSEQRPAIRVIDRRRHRTPALGDLLPGGAETSVWEGEAPALAVLAETYLGQRELNLLQGDLAVEPDWQAGWRKWRTAAVLAGVLVLTHLAKIGLENHQLETRNEALQQAMTALYRETFPEAVRVINPVVQLRNRLQELHNGDDGAGGANFIGIIAGAGKHFLADDNVGVKRVRYREGRMEIDLDADTIERLEAVQRRLREADYNAQLKSVNNEGGRFQGRLSVAEEAA